ncbi:MAG: hypothetical protein IV106_08205 [Pseudomonas umsongensis]|nr:hypothetical protein [Pseudomonas umsongensis]
MRKAALIPFLATMLSGCILQLPAPEPSSESPKVAATPSKAELPKPQPEISNIGWTDIGSVDEYRYQIQDGSFRFDKNSNGTALAVVIGRRIITTSQDILLLQWSVSAQDCVNERGSITVYDVNGNPSFQNDFVFGGGTLASIVAETVCAAAMKAAETIQEPTKKTSKPKGQAI